MGFGTLQFRTAMRPKQVVLGALKLRAAWQGCLRQDLDMPRPAGTLRDTGALEQPGSMQPTAAASAEDADVDRMPKLGTI